MALSSQFNPALANVPERIRQLIASLDPASAALAIAQYDTRQAMWDMLGSYPQDNVLPYLYSFQNVGATVVVASTTVQQSIKISADSAFVACSVRGVSTGPYSIFMRTDSSDRQLQNLTTHSQALVGTAQRPGILHKPLLLPANTTISFDLTDLSGANNTIYFTFAGFKVYNRSVQ